MRIVRYKTHGPVGGDSWKHGSLTELLFSLPLLAHVLHVWKVIAPLHILNEILGSGVSEAGMSGGCQWQPFQISESEYAELVEDLVTLPEASLSVDGELQGGDNLNEWTRRVISKYTGRDSK